VSTWPERRTEFILFLFEWGFAPAYPKLSKRKPTDFEDDWREGDQVRHVMDHDARHNALIRLCPRQKG
jgi:hypothetical protein